MSHNEGLAPILSKCLLVGANFELELLTNKKEFENCSAKLCNSKLEDAAKPLKNFLVSNPVEKISLHYVLEADNQEVTAKVWKFILAICEIMFRFQTPSLAFALIAHQSQKHWNLWYQKSRNNVLQFGEITKRKDYDVRIFIENSEKGKEEVLNDKHLAQLVDTLKSHSASKPFRKLSILAHSFKGISDSGIQKVGEFLKAIQHPKELKSLDFYLFARAPKPYGIQSLFFNLKFYTDTLEELTITFASMFTYRDEQIFLFQNALEEFLGKSLRKLSIYVGSFFLTQKTMAELFHSVEKFRNQLTLFGFSFWTDNNDFSEETLWTLFHVIGKFNDQLTHLNLALLSVRLTNKTLKELLIMLEPLAKQLLVFKFYTQSFSLSGEAEVIKEIATKLPNLVEGECISEMIGNKQILADNLLVDTSNSRMRMQLASRAVRGSKLLKVFRRRLILIELLEKFI